MRLYYSTISEYNKAIIAKAFAVKKKDNTKYTILITTNAYGIAINNLNIRLVMQ